MPRPRGRPVGSKNSPSSSNNQQNQSANFPPNLFALSDPNFMTSFMSFYSNPAFSAAFAKDPAYFQKLVAEYYKILIGPSLLGSVGPTLPNLTSQSPSNAILNQLSQASSFAKSHISTSSITTTTSSIPSSLNTSHSSKTPSVPQFDMKNLIASAASQVAKSTGASQSSSATISVGTGQLTITPTMSKPPVSNTLSLPQNSPQISQITPKPSSSSSVSIIKLPSSSPTLSVKPLSELMGSKPSTSSSIPNLLDLPKSLTITPTSLISPEKSKTMQTQMPQVSLIPDNVGSDSLKFQTKMKTSKKSKIPTAPYQKSQTPPQQQPLTAAQLGNMQSLSQQFPSLASNLNLQNYNQQVALLNSYAELLKSVGGMNSNPTAAALLQQSLNLSQFQMPPQKRPYTKRGRTPKVQSQQRYPTSMPIQSSGSSSTTENISTISVSGTSSTSFNNIPLSSISNKQTKTQTFPSPFNMPLSKSPIMSPSPSPVLPPPSIPAGLSILAQTTSPTKTLQQKLAEKQKANALNESSSKSTNSGKDVIILD